MTMKLSIVLSTQPTGFSALVHSEDFESSVRRIADAGFDGVELAVRDPKLLDVLHMKQILERHGLEVPAIGTGQAYGEEGLSFIDPDLDIRERAVQRIKDQVDLAAHLKAVVIIGLIRGVVPEGRDRTRSIEWLLESLSEVSLHAYNRGVRLALEPINRYETNLFPTVNDVLKVVEASDPRVVGVLFDTFHANIEEVSIENSIRRCIGRLFHVHVADSNRWAPGDGHLDFPGIVDVLREVGYDGYLSAEILPLPDAETSARRVIEHLRPLLRR